MRNFVYSAFWIPFFASCGLVTGALAQTTPISHPLELNYAAPDSYLIEDIQITGAQALDKEAIVALLGIKPGDTIQIPGPAISDALQRLWQQKLVKDVAVYASQVTDHRVVLTVSITENPRLSDYSFEGIKGKEQEKLMEKLTLAKGRIVTEEFIKNTQEIIQNYWLEEGYLYATVAIASLPDAALPDHVRLEIKIDKGDRPSINTVYFKGNHRVSSHVLKGQMQHVREKPRFTLVKDVLKQVATLRPFSKGGVLWRPISLKESWDYAREHVIPFFSRWNQAKFEEDKKRIVSYYQSQGFRDASIVEDTVSRQEGTVLNVCMTVEEGIRYRVGDIRWVGNHLYDDDTLSQILGIKKGDIFNPSLLQQGLYNSPTGEDIASLYMDEGYLFFQADPVETGLKGDTVDLEICIQEGPPVYINKVLIEGNTLSHDYVIRRELRTLPGDKFSRANIKRSYRELVQLNLFSPAIEIQPIPNFIDQTVDIRYKVKDRPQFEIKASGGWGGGSFMGAVILATNNFSLSNLLRSRFPMGGGQILGISAETDAKEYKNFALQFTEPWLGGKKPKYFHLSLNKAHEKERGSIGGNASLGTKLSWPDDYTSFMGSLAYHRHTYKDYDLLDNQQKSTGVLNDLAVSVSLKRDSTGPSPIYPKEGSKLVLNASLTPPWSFFLNEVHSESYALGQYHWKEYHQWMVDGSYFLQLLEDLVLNVRGHFGVLGRFSSQRNIGPFERFSLGGVNSLKRTVRGKEYISLRGYEEDYIMPQDEVSGYKGGVIYDKVVLELRYPIISNYLASAYVLAFVEGGNTWVRYKDFAPFDLRRSVGVGFRVYLPFIIGTTVGFDWGYGFDKTLADQRGDKLEFHFSIGTDLR
jgi:outer membrane protein insertion porin family